VTVFKAVPVFTQERDLQNLQELDLSGTGVNDAGLLHLKTLQRLDLKESVPQISSADNQCQHR
jgi:hypothetical protein